MSPILGRKRINFPETQNKILLQMFQGNTFPTKEERRKLAMSFNTTEKRITNWYRSKRYKQGTKERLCQG